MTPSESTLQVYLDGELLALPPTPLRTLSGIRAFLTSEALRRQRMLCGISLDGWPVDTSTPLPTELSAKVVASRTTSFQDLPAHLVQLAREQAINLQSKLERTSLRMAINEAAAARQLWWNLVPELHELLVTLCLVNRLRNVGAGASAAFSLGALLSRIEGNLAMPGEGFEISDHVEIELRQWLEVVERELSNIHEFKAHQQS
ncbi:MAG: hypothetical protein EBS05_09755 [Proteobacteria bacterium]|nr:hypothetical protein [Pseudomonadota bacterium]